MEGSLFDSNYMNLNYSEAWNHINDIYKTLNYTMVALHYYGIILI